tara:strand:+ start:793 stop:1578 length:786 start_codon:yes stop_codon:yes gene_type:complete
MLSYPNINPTILNIGPLQLQWYGLMYIIGIIAGTQFCKKYLLKLGFKSEEVYDLVSYIVLGMLLGGRIGYVLFYNLSFYISNPLKIIAIWEGGMSYHGGAIGCALAIIWASKKYKKNVLSLLDLMGIGSTFGLFFGRIGNFINGELYGRPTNSWVGMIFPNGGNIPRHPSQLYESFLEGFVLFWILFFVLRYFKLNPGYLFCLYVGFYGLFRFIIEYFREPDTHLGFIIGKLSMGQCLSSIMILFALSLSHYLYHYYYPKK